MTPETRRYCGDKPAGMLRHLVALSFNNIETLYTHMGLQDQVQLHLPLPNCGQGLWQLPPSCKSLGELSDNPPPLSAAVGQPGSLAARPDQPPHAIPGSGPTSAAVAPVAALLLLLSAFLTSH